MATIFSSAVTALVSSSKNTSSTWKFSDDVLPNAYFIDMSIRCGGTVVSSPIEEGSFFSYNKTTEPLEISATIAFTGTDSYLQTCLEKLKTLKEGVIIFSIITPIYEYENMNLESFDYSLKREDGLGVLYINATFIEIKEVQLSYTDTEITTTNTTDVSAVSCENNGITTTEEITSGDAEYSVAASSASNIYSTESISGGSGSTLYSIFGSV